MNQISEMHGKCKCGNDIFEVHSLNYCNNGIIDSRNGSKMTCTKCGTVYTVIFN